MTKTAETQPQWFADMVAEEYASFHRSAGWELRNINTALNLMPFLNGPREEARLEAVRTIQRERRRRPKT